MKRNTDQFETVLPTEELQRVVAPGLFLSLVTRETLDQIRAQHEEFRKVCEPPPPPQKPLTAGFPRWPLGVVMISSFAIFVVLALSHKPTSAPNARSLVESPGWPAVEPTPSLKEALDRAYRDAPDPPPRAPRTPRAELIREPAVSGYVTGYDELVEMPYGGLVGIKWRGALSRQEDLPTVGNHIGDAHRIDQGIFVWVAPNGVEQWIDPQWKTK